MAEEFDPDRLWELLESVYHAAREFLKECPGCQDIVNPDVCEGDTPTKVQKCACYRLRLATKATKAYCQKTSADAPVSFGSN